VSKVVRWEFMGSWLLFWAMSISMVGIPLAILYLLNGTIRIEEEVPDVERLVEFVRARK
jgi:hypothetical protein